MIAYSFHKTSLCGGDSKGLGLVCEQKATKCERENDKNESLARHCVFNEHVLSKENHYRVFY